MIKINSKAQLAVILSRLKGFNSAKVRFEQYATDSEAAATVLWQAFLVGDTAGKVVIDLGCGTGVLGLGTMILGAKSVYFVEKDLEAIELAKNNCAALKSEFKPSGEAFFELKDVQEFDKRADCVVQNPPFGTKSKHADRVFLNKAFELADIVYSFHKSSTKPFVESFSRDKGFKITNYWEFNFPLKATMPYHEKRIQRIKVGCWRFEKEKVFK